MVIREASCKFQTWLHHPSATCLPHPHTPLPTIISSGPWSSLRRTHTRSFLPKRCHFTIADCNQNLQENESSLDENHSIFPQHAEATEHVISLNTCLGWTHNEKGPGPPLDRTCRDGTGVSNHHAVPFYDTIVLLLHVARRFQKRPRVS